MGNSGEDNHPWRSYRGIETYVRAQKFQLPIVALGVGTVASKASLPRVSRYRKLKVSDDRVTDTIC